MVKRISRSASVQEFQRLKLKPGDFIIDEDLSRNGIDKIVRVIELTSHEKHEGFEYHAGGCLYTTDDDIMVVGYCNAPGESSLIHQRTRIYSPRMQFLKEFPEFDVLDFETEKILKCRPKQGPIYEAHQELRKEFALSIIRYEELKQFLDSQNPVTSL